MTNEQKWQHVLEWCGFTKLPGSSYRGRELWLHPGEIYVQGEPDCFDGGEPLYRLPRRDSEMALPDITLDNLFKWVVPMLPKEWRNWKSILHDWVEGLTGDREKDTIALLDAIYEAVK